ncbi:hypothetical protein H8356DRAFT_1427790 [Neocallimastix lanati (nom. inval.)]|nr:hypothetical protein H8356DRAFT_1427790 [Neocallimastix sp. JGI-2020a]
MPKRKNNKKAIEESSSSSTPTDRKENGTISPITHYDSENDDVTNNSDLFDVDDNPNSNKNITINKINKYYDNTLKSAFDIKNFEMSKENFPDWYEPLRRHLIANDLDTFIDKQVDIKIMNRKQIIDDNAVQSIIINNLNKTNQNYLSRCRIAYQMTQRLKKRYYQSIHALLNILEQKIKNLKINNNDYIQYINELNNLFEQYQIECENLNKKSMDEETNLLYSSIELDKIVNELYKRHNFFEKANILKYSNNISIDLNNNNVNKGKSYNNINSNKEHYCHICKVKGHSTNFCKFNSLNKENNNYKNNSFKNKNNYKNHNNIKGEKKEDSLLIISFYHHQKSLLFPISYIFLGLAEFLTNIMPNMIGDFYYYDQFRIPPLSREHRLIIVEWEELEDHFFLEILDMKESDDTKKYNPKKRVALDDYP